MLYSRFLPQSFRQILLAALFFLPACSGKAPTSISPTLAAESTVEAYTQQFGAIRTARLEEYFQYLEHRLLTALPASAPRFTNARFVMLDTHLKMAGTPGGGLVVLSKGFFLSMESEGELAFALAHELSHQILGHEMLPAEKPHSRRSEELEADGYALGLIALAGYDPRVSAGALLRSAGSNVLWRPADPESDYPSIEERFRNIQNLIAKTSWRPPGTRDRRDFQLLRKQLALGNY